MTPRHPMEEGGCRVYRGDSGFMPTATELVHVKILFHIFCKGATLSFKNPAGKHPGCEFRVLMLKPVGGSSVRPIPEASLMVPCQNITAVWSTRIQFHCVYLVEFLPSRARPSDLQTTRSPTEPELDLNQSQNWNQDQDPESEPETEP